MDTISILIADDHKIIRDGLKAMLESSDKIKVVAEANNGSEVLGWMGEIPVDLILLDISMPVMDGFETAQLLRTKFPDVKILALSMHHDELNITKILKAGAKGYVLKNAGRDELLKAIETVIAGGSYFSDDISQILLSKYLGASSNTLSGKFVNDFHLTTRELEILALIGKEMTNKEIGDKLFISQRTVDTHRRNIMQKLGVKNSVGLIKYAISAGLVTD